MLKHSVNTRFAHGCATCAFSTHELRRLQPCPLLVSFRRCRDCRLLRSLSVYILNQLFFSISVNSGSIFNNNNIPRIISNWKICNAKLLCKGDLVISFVTIRVFAHCDRNLCYLKQQQQQRSMHFEVYRCEAFWNGQVPWNTKEAIYN